MNNNNWEGEEDESLQLILKQGENGKMEIFKEEDYVQILRTEMKIIQSFIENNKLLFEEHIRKTKLKRGSE